MLYAGLTSAYQISHTTEEDQLLPTRRTFVLLCLVNLAEAARRQHAADRNSVQAPIRTNGAQ